MIDTNAYSGPIDAVYLWVSHSASAVKPGFQEELVKQGISPDQDCAGDNRFRDNGELRYSLRSLEKFAPWINRIHIVTDGQRPHWLKATDRINFVSHDSIFEDKKCLPTFNSNAIELQIHRIPGLSRYFLYFNDDLFLGREIDRTDFISASGEAIFYLDEIPFSDVSVTGTESDAALLSTRDAVARTIECDAPEYIPAHVPQLYDRDVIKDLESQFTEDFRATAHNRFRSIDDFLLRVAYVIFSTTRKNARTPTPVTRVLKSGSDDYSFVRYRAHIDKMSNELLHIFQVRPKFFCINDELGTGPESIYLAGVLPSFLASMYPDRAVYEPDAARAINETSTSRSFWNKRLASNWGLHGVGSLDYGHNYNGWLYKIRAKIFSEILDTIKPELTHASVLDVGCGTGFYVEQWQRYGIKNISGVDISDVAIQMMDKSFPGFSFDQMDISGVIEPENVGRYDVISAMDILFHIVDDKHYRAALKNLYDYLAPGGSLILSENFLHHGERQHGSYWRARTKAGLEKMLEDAGFSIITRRPMFAIMNCPVDTKNSGITRLWELAMYPVRKSERLGYITGALLYPLERVLLQFMKESPSTEVMVCRKAVRA